MLVSAKWKGKWMDVVVVAWRAMDVQRLSCFCCQLAKRVQCANAKATEKRKVFYTVPTKYTNAEIGRAHV